MRAPVRGNKGAMSGHSGYKEATQKWSNIFFSSPPSPPVNEKLPWQRMCWPKMFTCEIAAWIYLPMKQYLITKSGVGVKIGFLPGLCYKMFYSIVMLVKAVWAVFTDSRTLSIIYTSKSTSSASSVSTLGLLPVSNVAKNHIPKGHYLY